MYKFAWIIFLLLAVGGCDRQDAGTTSKEGAAAPQSAPGNLASRIPAPVRAACDVMADLMKPVPGSVLQRLYGSFEDDFGYRHSGCQVLLNGSFSALREGENPADIPGVALPDRGWNMVPEYSADGPDGTLYALRKDDTLCFIRGEWDGGDDSDPGYIPADWYKIAIGCTSDSAKTSGAAEQAPVSISDG